MVQPGSHLGRGARRHRSVDVIAVTGGAAGRRVGTRLGGVRVETIRYHRPAWYLVITAR